MKLTLVGLLLLVTAASTSCGSRFSPELMLTVTKSASQVGCASFKDEFYDSVYNQILRSPSIATKADYNDAVGQLIDSTSSLQLSKQEKAKLKNSLSDLYETLTVTALTNVNKKDKKAQLTAITSLELGDQTTAEKNKIQNQIKSKLQEIQTLAAGSNSACTGTSTGTTDPGTKNPTPTDSQYITYLKNHLSAPVYGAWKTLATAYQTCNAPFLSPVNASTPDVQGISIVGRNADGIGLSRDIASVQEVASTHYYIKNFNPPNSQCFAVNQDPLIYNYGGKPDATSSVESKLDFFTSAGTGTNVLGVDCSGFVYSAFATAGLKLKRDGRLKAIDVFGISSTMMFSPQNNGLTCLNAIPYTAPTDLQTGDLVVEQGHVVMVDQLSADPFGLANITKASDCTTKNIAISHFNFIIIQSAPVKGGMGMNRYVAADYLTTNGTMATGLVNYAESLCQAKFSAKPTHTSSTIAIVRHSSDDACVDTAIALNKEECLNSCPVPTSL